MKTLMWEAVLHPVILLTLIYPPLVTVKVKNVAQELIASAAGNVLLPYMYGQLASTVASPLVNPLKVAVSLGMELRTTVKELRLLESMRENGLITADEWRRARLRQMAACSTACLSSGLTGVTGALVGVKVGQ